MLASHTFASSDFYFKIVNDKLSKCLLKLVLLSTCMQIKKRPSYFHGLLSSIPIITCWWWLNSTADMYRWNVWFLLLWIFGECNCLSSRTNFDTGSSKQLLVWYLFPITLHGTHHVFTTNNEHFTLQLNNSQSFEALKVHTVVYFA